MALDLIGLRPSEATGVSSKESVIFVFENKEEAVVSIMVESPELLLICGVDCFGVDAGDEPRPPLAKERLESGIFTVKLNWLLKKRLKRRDYKVWEWFISVNFVMGTDKKKSSVHERKRLVKQEKKKAEKSGNCM